LKTTIKISAFWMLGTFIVHASSQNIPMDPQKRVKAIISKDSMNRLAVTNDRITQVFGDEQSYTVQTEEGIGQIFLKPTLENGDKPLSLTLITENGSVQDMTLVPQERDAATIVLTGRGTSRSVDAAREEAETGRGFNYQAHPYFQNADYRPSLKNQLVRAMKVLVSNRLPEMETEALTRKPVEGFDLDYKSSHQIGSLKGLVYEVKNTTTTPIEIDERQFYSSGDLALSFTKRLLNPQETTHFYILVADDPFIH